MVAVVFPNPNKGLISLGISMSSSLYGRLQVGRKTLKAGQNIDNWLPHMYLDLGQEPRDNGQQPEQSRSCSLLRQPRTLYLGSPHGTPTVDISPPSLAQGPAVAGIQLGPASVSPALPWGRKKEASWKFRKRKAKKEPTIGPN